VHDTWLQRNSIEIKSFERKQKEKEKEEKVQDSYPLQEV